MCCLYTLYIDRRKLGIETAAAAGGCACFYRSFIVVSLTEKIQIWYQEKLTSKPSSLVVQQCVTLQSKVNICGIELLPSKRGISCLGTLSFPWIAYAPISYRNLGKVIPPLGGVVVTSVVWFGLVSFLNEVLISQQLSRSVPCCINIHMTLKGPFNFRIKF
ncbi:hypothetical protein GQ457_04G039230 [Hibiscus cannabinus]